MENLCCPECEYSMSENEWESLRKDEDDDMIICPHCEEEISMDDLLSEEDLDEEE